MRRRRAPRCCSTASSRTFARGSSRSRARPRGSSCSRTTFPACSSRSSATHPRPVARKHPESGVPTAPMAPQVLQRRLGPIDAAAIIVSNVIGGGILFTPPQVAASVPHPWLFLGTWLAGGLLAFAGAMAYAELAALRPRAGGEYVYLRAAFGKLAAFLTGWTSFVAGFTGATAASAVVLAFYMGRFIPAANDATPLLVIPVPFVPLPISRQSTSA